MPTSIRLRRAADAAWSTFSNLPRLIPAATTLIAAGPKSITSFAIAALTVSAVVTLTVATTPVWAVVDDDLMEDLGIYVPGFFAELQDIELGGPDRAYFFGVGGFGIVDISDLDNPSLISRYQPPGHPYNRFYRGAVYQNAAYGGGREDLMSIIDITSEVSIDLVRVHGSAGQSFEGIAVNAAHLYVARHGDGVEILDLTDPLDPVTVAEVTSLTNAWDLAFKDDFALVADGIGGLAILDVSNPATPIHLTTLPTSGAAVDVDVTGDLAVVANGSAGVDIFDISDPADPFLVSTFNTSGLAITLDATGDLVFVADWDDVEVIDVSNPAAPTSGGWENTPVRAMGLAAEGDLVVVADWSRIRLYRYGPTTRGDIDLSVAGIAFGNVPVGVTVDTTFTVSNTGGGVIDVTEVIEFGDNFVVQPPNAFMVAPGESHEVTVSFTHAVPGYDATFLRVDSDDQDEWRITLPLTADDNPDYLDIGEQAPDFSHTDRDGVVHNLSDYRGRVVVMAFFANW